MKYKHLQEEIKEKSNFVQEKLILNGSNSSPKKKDKKETK